MFDEAEVQSQLYFESVKPEYERAKRQLDILQHNQAILAFIIAYGHPSHIGIIAEDVKEVSERINMIRVACARFEATFPEEFVVPTGGR